jgi:putative membrane protein
LRKLRDYILLFFKGMGMGAADVVPGVSGGTVAFITGIYDELLQSIKSVDGQALQLLVKLKFREFWQKINGSFLITILAGIATSIFSLAKIMLYLLKNQPILIWSFFFGLILISTPLVLRAINKWRAGSVIAFITGAAIAYFITIVSPSQTPDELWFVFIAGSLAICAMILPGISGAFILVLLKKYQFMMAALTEFKVVIVAVFIAGCLTGLLTFSRLLSWIFSKYHSIAVAMLGGFMLGSLNKVWPWRKPLEYITNSKGEQTVAFDESTLPWHYLSATGKDPQLFQAILMMALGVFIVVLIEKIAVRLKTKH